MSTDRITARYIIETAHSPARVAETIAGEQSTGTFVKVPGETAELRAIHGAHIESVIELETVDTPSLPGAHPPKGNTEPLSYKRAEIVLSFPLINMGTNLSILMSTIAGGQFEMGPLSGIRLMDFDVPDAFADKHPGPKFGVRGTRELTGVWDRPVIGTIMKPNLGLTPEETAERVKQLAEAGIDFIKDDELNSNPPFAPFADRVKAVMRVINDHAEKTGKKVMYGFNLTDDIDSMLRHHDTLLEAGGTCLMVNLITVGLAGVRRLSEHAQLPIHGHRNGWGMWTRHPLLGMEHRAFFKLYRLAGVDHHHVNGIRNKFCESDESSVAGARSLLTPMLGGYEAMPVFSSGQWAGMAPDTYKAIQSNDLIFLCGGGIMGHPGGPAAGVESVRQGWEAAMQGIPLLDYAKTHQALRQAVEMYGEL